MTVLQDGNKSPLFTGSKEVQEAIDVYLDEHGRVIDYVRFDEISREVQVKLSTGFKIVLTLEALEKGRKPQFRVILC